MKYIIDLLEIKEAHQIGSAKDKKLKYASDVDLEEFINLTGSLDDVLKIFQKKFKEAKESNNIWITDFKCGESHSGIPFRWSYDDIMKGYQLSNKQPVYFIDQLKNKSIIKLDVVALINGKLTEFSNNYYFRFGKHFTKPTKYESYEKSILRDAIYYQQNNMYFKSLKRIYSFYKFKNNKIEQRKLLKIFNSKIGKLNHAMNSLGIFILMLTQTFRPIDQKILLKQLKLFKSELPTKYRKLFNAIINDPQTMLTNLEVFQKNLNADVNTLLFKYIDQHKINISPINIYNNAKF